MNDKLSSKGNHGIHDIALLSDGDSVKVLVTGS